MTREQSEPQPQRPRPDIPPHPSPRAGLPPRAQDHPDRGTYREPWWIGGGSVFKTIALIVAVLVLLSVLRHVVGPMLSPSGP